MYSESTERMKVIQKDYNFGKVSAVAVNSMVPQPSEGVRGCWKCGGMDHCPKADAIRAHRCSKCGVRGHLGKFCRSNGDDGQRQGQPKKSFQASQIKDRGKSNSKGAANGQKPSSNNTARRRKVIQDAMARLLTLGQEEDDEVDSDHEEDKPGDEDMPEEDEDVFFTGCTVCEVDDAVIDGSGIVGSQALLSTQKRFIIDSGYRGAHVVSSSDLVEKTIDTSK